VTVLLGLIAAAMWAVTDTLNQRISRQAGALAGLWAVLALVLPLALVLALAVDGVPTRDHLPALGAGFLAGCLDAVALGLLMVALRDGDLAIVGPLAALEGGFAAIGSLILGANLSTLELVGIPLAVVGGALAAMTGRSKLDRGAAEALGAALIFAFVLLLFQPATHAGALTAATVARIGSTVCVLPFAVRAGVLRPAAPIARIAFVAGLLDLMGFAAYARAAHHGPVAVAAVAASQFATIIVAIGVIGFGERPRRHQWAGIVLTLTGVAALAYGSA
jgi:S-adenosylmethionine uptake transporter